MCETYVATGITATPQGFWLVEILVFNGCNGQVLTRAISERPIASGLALAMILQHSTLLSVLAGLHVAGSDGLAIYSWPADSAASAMAHCEMTAAPGEHSPLRVLGARGFTQITPKESRMTTWINRLLKRVGR